MPKDELYAQLLSERCPSGPSLGRMDRTRGWSLKRFSIGELTVRLAASWRAGAIGRKFVLLVLHRQIWRDDPEVRKIFQNEGLTLVEPAVVEEDATVGDERSLELLLDGGYGGDWVADPPREDGSSCGFKSFYFASLV